MTLRYQDVSLTLIPPNNAILTYLQGYDHSYFFISTFGEDHVKHAAKALGLL